MDQKNVSQIKFYFKIILGPKNIGSKQIFGSRNCGSKKCLVVVVVILYQSKGIASENTPQANWNGRTGLFQVQDCLAESAENLTFSSFNLVEAEIKAELGKENMNNKVVKYDTS